MIGLGHRLKYALARKGWTQDRLALECGWENAQGRISNYLNGIRQPRHEYLLKLADVLDVSPEWLLTGDGEMSKNHTFSSEERELVALYRGMSPDQRALFSEIGKNFGARTSSHA